MLLSNSSGGLAQKELIYELNGFQVSEAVTRGIKEVMKDKVNKDIYKYSTPVSFKDGKLYYHSYK